MKPTSGINIYFFHSVDALLTERTINADEMLMRLGFCSQMEASNDFSRIPERFYETPNTGANIGQYLMEREDLQHLLNVMDCQRSGSQMPQPGYRPAPGQSDFQIPNASCFSEFIGLLLERQVPQHFIDVSRLTQFWREMSTDVDFEFKNEKQKGGGKVFFQIQDTFDNGGDCWNDCRGLNSPEECETQLEMPAGGVLTERPATLDLLAVTDVVDDGDISVCSFSSSSTQSYITYYNVDLSPDESFV